MTRDAQNKNAKILTKVVTHPRPLTSEPERWEADRRSCTEKSPKPAKEGPRKGSKDLVPGAYSPRKHDPRCKEKAVSLGTRPPVDSEVRGSEKTLKTPRNYSPTSPLAEVWSPWESAESRAAGHCWNSLFTAPPSCSVRCRWPGEPVPTPPARSESGNTKVPAGGSAGERFDCATVGSDVTLSFRSAGLWMTAASAASLKHSTFSLVASLAASGQQTKTPWSGVGKLGSGGAGMRWRPLSPTHSRTLPAWPRLCDQVRRAQSPWFRKTAS